MANFLAVVDRDEERRSRCVEEGLDRLEPVSGLTVERRGCRGFSVVWAAHDSSPVDTVVDPAGCAVVWGRPISSDGGRPVTADGVREAARASAPRFATWDGYYAALAFTPAGHLVAGADLLGLFPVYYHRGRDVLLVSSSPEMMRCHPAFRPSLDIRGFAGILLTGGSFDGRTLWRGVRRLSPGHVLRCDPGRSARELVRFHLDPPTDLFDLPFSEHRRLLLGALEGAVSRQVDPGEATTLLLSGGRDSRLLLGLARRAGRVPSSLTFGRRDDYEAICARAVADQVGSPHRLVELNADRYPSWAERHVRWEHLASPLAGMYTWGSHHELRTTGRRVLSGHLLELAVGGIQQGWVCDPATGATAASTFLERANRHAVPLSALRPMTRSPELGDAVQERVRRIGEVYDGYAVRDSLRAQRFLYEHWGRHHPGSAPWRFSFGAWPVLPVLDRSLLEISAGIPLASVGGRRLEEELLRSEFPDLARLPLDRNSADVTPLAPRASWKLRRWLGRAKRRARSALPWWGSDERERRYYYRIYDFDGPGWRSVRRAAEPYRESLAEHLSMEGLERYLPPPSGHVDTDDPIVDSFGRKTLIGLMWWMGTHAH